MKILVDTAKNNWLEKKPSEWDVLRIKNLFELSKEKNHGDDLPVLSLTQKGIKQRDISNNEGQMAESYDNYTRIRPDDLVFNPMDLRTGAVDLSITDGVISLAYSVLRKRQKVKIYLKYYKYYFQWHYLDKILFPFGQGVSVDHRWTLKDNILLNFPILIPPLEDQKQIADFLDKKTKLIDQIIEKKKKLIELLKEKRISIITQAVTKGLDPKAKMKPSGVEWIGDMPEGWKVLKLKFLSDVQASNVDKISYSNEQEVILCNYIDVYKNEYITNKLDFMKSTASSDQIKKLTIHSGNILLTKDSETADDIGVPAFVKDISGIKSLVCGYHLYLVKSEHINPKFLFRYLQGKKVRGKFEISSNGVTRFGLSNYPLINLKILIPPLKEQEQVTKYIDTTSEKIDLSIMKLKEQKEKFIEYRSSLIYNAVIGKIKVN